MPVEVAIVVVWKQNVICGHEMPFPSTMSGDLVENFATQQCCFHCLHCGRDYISPVIEQYMREVDEVFPCNLSETHLDKIEWVRRNREKREDRFLVGNQVGMKKKVEHWLKHRSASESM